MPSKQENKPYYAVSKDELEKFYCISMPNTVLIFFNLLYLLKCQTVQYNTNAIIKCAYVLK